MTFERIITHLRSGELDLVEYVNTLCDRIEEKEPEIQAIIPGTYDRRRLLSDVDLLLKQAADPSSRPPLFGVPVGVKDIIRIDGVPTRCGSALPAELFDGPEADCIKRLKRAGAIMTAKTVTTEFAFREPGPTRNPHNLEHTPGGSSSGSAAGVASGFFPLAIGSQTVGSVIRPAAFCGIAGFKPSFGRISTDGVIPYSVSADHVGFFCEDFSAAGTVMSVLSDDWRPEDENTSPGDVTLGIPEGPYLDRITDNGRDFFEKQLKRLKDAGCKMKRIRAFSDFASVEINHRLLIAGEMARYHAPWLEKNRHLYRPRTLEQIEKGLKITDEKIQTLQKWQLRFRETLETQMRSEGIHCWICPSATDHAPKGLESTGDAVMNLPWTSAGLPVATIPAGKDGFGLPQGVQVIGHFMEDERLIPVAEKLFAVLSGNQK